MEKCVMPSHRIPGVLVMLVCATVGMRAQTNGQKAPAPTKSPAIPLPTKMVECENFDTSCVSANAPLVHVWNFTGTQGKWHDDNVTLDVDLTIKHFDGNLVVIERIDHISPFAGLIGIYTGTIAGKNIRGSIVYDWPGHPQFPKNGTWTARIEDPPPITSQAPAAVQVSPSTPKATTQGSQTLPVSMPQHWAECEGWGEDCSGVWTFDGVNGKAAFRPFGAFSIQSDLTVLRFTPADVQIERKDTSRPGFTALYRGRIIGNEMGGRVTWSWPGHGSIYDPPVEGPWHAKIAEAPQADFHARPLFNQDGCPVDLPPVDQDSNSFQQWAHGSVYRAYALDQQTELDALAWFCKAANVPEETHDISAGRAAFDIGEMYFDGFSLPSVQGRSQGVRPDIGKALSWYRKASRFDNTNAMDRLALLSMGGPSIKGSPLANSDPQLAIKILSASARLGDTWAMKNLAIVYAAGLDANLDPKRQGALAAEWTAKREIAVAEAAAKCNTPSIIADIIEDTPERPLRIRKIDAVEAYGNFFVCVAHLGDVQDKDKDHELWGNFSGAVIYDWDYTVIPHHNGDGSPANLVVRTGLRFMVEKYLDPFATFVAATKKKQ